MKLYFPFAVLLALCVSGSYGFDQTEVDSMWQHATKIYQEHLVNLTKSGVVSRQRRFAKTTPESLEMSKNSNIHAIYEDLMIKKHGLTRYRGSQTQTRTPAVCQPFTFSCNGAATARYRTVDGTCNNLQNPRWGSRNHSLNRVLPNAYENRRSVPRGGFSSYLPGARDVSTAVHFDSNPVNKKVTNMVPQFGQFLDHDITFTADAGSPCCANDRSDVDCWAIRMWYSDSFYSSQKPPQRCIDFTRSTTCQRNGVREQVNSITAYIDGSQIYGSDSERVQKLRSHQGGRLVTSPDNKFLPSGVSLNINVTGQFVAGDDRINAMPGLIVMHTLFLKEHNRIADQLKKLTGSTDDEFLFQETRRILIALLQNIVYSEYLPVLMDPGSMSKYNLELPASTPTTYNDKTDASIINSFATAAYRFGHSMVPTKVKLIAKDNSEVGSYLIKDEFFQSRQVTKDNGQGYEYILRSLMTQNAPEMDRHCSDSIRNFLFKPQNQDFGSDLIARNIQRGRDHGLPSYSAFRVFCGLSALTRNWDIKPAEISQSGWNSVKAVYLKYRNYPTDIDLFTGGLLEEPVKGGITGPTFQCLKGIQFQRLKDGDRYFFTHNVGDYSFNDDQRREILKQKLSDIICRNSEQPDAPENAFLVKSESNKRVACADREEMNLNLFV